MYPRHRRLRRRVPLGAHPVRAPAEAGLLRHRPGLHAAPRPADARHAAYHPSHTRAAAAPADGDEPQGALQGPLQDHHRDREHRQERPQAHGQEAAQGPHAGVRMKSALYKRVRHAGRDAQQVAGQRDSAVSAAA